MRLDEMTVEIERREKELEELKKKHAAMKAEPADQQLARYLHDKMCNFNHTDGCSWHYEINNGLEDWNAYAHASYLKRLIFCSPWLKTLGCLTCSASSRLLASFLTVEYNKMF